MSISTWHHIQCVTIDVSNWIFPSFIFVENILRMAKLRVDQLSNPLLLFCCCRIQSSVFIPILAWNPWHSMPFETNELIYHRIHSISSNFCIDWFRNNRRFSIFDFQFPFYTHPKWASKIFTTTRFKSTFKLHLLWVVQFFAQRKLITSTSSSAIQSAIHKLRTFAILLY